MSAKKRYTAKVAMFISSYFPLYIMLTILHFDKINSMEKIMRPKAILFASGILICIVISLFSVYAITQTSATRILSIEEVERPEDTIISYMMTYIIPILTTNFLDSAEILVNVVLFLLIGYLYIRLNLLYLNPLWALFGYLAFRMNEDTVVITNMKYSEVKIAKRNKRPLKCAFIANDIAVVRKKDQST